MAGWDGTRFVRLAMCSGTTLAALGVAAFLFAASGLYSVAASRGHFAVTEWFLEFALRRSVATHSLAISPPRLDDPAMVRLGAGHFASGCAPCHGAPGEPRSPIVRQMLPPPPDLAVAAPTWPREQLFWIVQNGLKYTGMPAWTAPERDDEVWSVVAFLRALPGMDEQAYRTLVGSTVPAATDGAAGAAGESVARAACGRCHGDEARAPIADVVPRLAGQSPHYLAAALHDYAAGLRPSGIMQPVAEQLDAPTVAALAAYYAERRVDAERHVTPAPPEQIARGRAIATIGVPEARVPPCAVCHVAGIPAVFPRLAGQHATYLAGQLRLWQRGLRDRTARGAIMAPIARRLSDRQIDDVAAYFASLAPVPPGAVSQRGRSRSEVEP
jgi:cytochrome c553